MLDLLSIGLILYILYNNKYYYIIILINIKIYKLYLGNIV